MLELKCERQIGLKFLARSQEGLAHDFQGGEGRPKPTRRGAQVRGAYLGATDRGDADGDPRATDETQVDKLFFVAAVQH